MNKYRVSGFINLHICIDDEFEADTKDKAIDQAFDTLGNVLDYGKIISSDIDVELMNE